MHMYGCVTVQGTSVSEMRPDTPYSDPTRVLLAEDIPDIETLEITIADDSSAGAEETVDALLNPTDAEMSDVLTDAEIAE